MENTAPTYIAGDGKVTADFGSSFDVGYSVTLQTVRFLCLAHG